MGFGIYLFQDLVTEVMLGNQWTEASSFIGLWALMEVVMIVFARFCSNVYPAVGKPFISVITQVLHLVFLIPTVIIAGHYGFHTLYIARSFIRLEGVLVNMIFVYITIKQSPWRMIQNVIPEFMACIIMSVAAILLLRLNDSIILSFIWIALCSFLYFVVLFLFPKERALLMEIKHRAFKRVF